MSKKEAPGTAKRGLFRIIFSRAGIFLILVLIQFGVFIATTFHLREYTFYIYGVFTILRVAVIIYIINRKGNPAFKITWILCVLAFPIVGTMFYVYVEMQVGTSFMQQRLTDLKLETSSYMQQDQDVVMRSGRVNQQMRICPIICLIDLVSQRTATRRSSIFRLGSTSLSIWFMSFGKRKSLSLWNILL